eukprot:Gregarina_sp_Poly_1__8037@NODE_461_length_8201_cov_115_438530_g375_i0_p8_GENE_NODE_461_length_8201_cov_115_438530_g375_i0NODE_461_length_8201_cov_115_438530_g375_i0_p8_ORF_typecomplete_len114_score18_23_NODE_461_length_8201_cov_115_438530_g375_i048555196
MCVRHRGGAGRGDRECGGDGASVLVAAGTSGSKILGCRTGFGSNVKSNSGGRGEGAGEAPEPGETSGLVLGETFGPNAGETPGLDAGETPGPSLESGEGLAAVEWARFRERRL